MQLLNFADLFCGAGGTTTGAKQAARRLGYQTQFKVFNHSVVSIGTHQLNHPQDTHYCAGIESFNPRLLYRPGELYFLLASPECTHHSNARGGKPINEQSRATAWDVVHWGEALMPDMMLIENVPEFRTWGPDRSRDGTIFQAWINSLRAIGYQVEYRVLVAADYGDPTTRRRLFVQAVRSGKGLKPCFPNAFYGPGTPHEYRNAENDIIDWSIEGTSIFERKKGLVVKTIQRVLVGLERFALAPFLLPGQNENPKSKKLRMHDIKKPCPTVTASGHIDLVKPSIIDCGKKAFIVQQRGTADSQITSSARSIKEPITPICTSGAHHSLAVTFLVQTAHGNGKEGEQRNARRVRSIKLPLPAVCGERGDFAKVTALLSQQSGGVARDVKQPAPAVATAGAIHKVDYIMSIDHQGGNGAPVRHVKMPLNAVTTKARHSLLQSFLVQYYGSGGATSAVAPCPTVTTKARFAINRPRLELVTDGTATFRKVDFYAWKRLIICQSRKKKKLTRLYLQIDGYIQMLEITQRMLQVHELAAAQGFKKDYQFTGTKTEQVKQIGNAVPRRLARALVAAMLSQNPDVSYLAHDDDGGAE